MKQYNFDDQDIPEDYYDSDEWIAYEDSIVERNQQEFRGQLVSKVTQDHNWNLLKEEHLLPPEEILTVAKISNCKFTIWLDTHRIMAQYDVGYTSGKKVLDRLTYGTWINEEAKSNTENLALDAIKTMIARSDIKAKIKFSRMYETEMVKDIVREISIIELDYNGPVAAWFIVGSNVYPARFSQMYVDRYEWHFNGRKKIPIKQFCDQCWKAVK